TGRGNALLNLFNNLPSGPFTSEDAFANGTGSGGIDLAGSQPHNTSTSYTRPSPVPKTTDVINYTLTSSGSTPQSVQVLDASVNGFNGTLIHETSGAFEDQSISNKQNVTIGIGGGTSEGSQTADQSVLINNPGATVGAHSLPLRTMTVET